MTRDLAPTYPLAAVPLPFELAHFPGTLGQEGPGMHARADVDEEPRPGVSTPCGDGEDHASYVSRRPREHKGDHALTWETVEDRGHNLLIFVQKASFGIARFALFQCGDGFPFCMLFFFANSFGWRRWERGICTLSSRCQL